MTGPTATAPGRLIGVVGPSGVGKDTVMAALVAAEPRLGLVRRVITRDPEAGGEPYLAATPAQFAQMQADGIFCLTWEAHGLHYGIPQEVPDRVAGGADLLVNLSRGVLAEAAALVAQFTVLSVTAAPETLAARLQGRGRESAADIATRLARSAKPIPPGLHVIELANDGAVEATVARARAALYDAALPGETTE